MASYAAEHITNVINKNKKNKNIKILILGYTFKENCPIIEILK